MHHLETSLSLRGQADFKLMRRGNDGQKAVLRLGITSNTVGRNVMASKITSEDIAYWYLRLNGFLMLRNFLVHGARKGLTGTEIDLLGVRFKHRREHLNHRMKDDDWIEAADKMIVVFCDAKAGSRGFNPPWRKPENLQSFLALVGVVLEHLWQPIAAELNKTGRSEFAPDGLVTLLLINHDPNSLVEKDPAQAQVLTIQGTLRFIFERFKSYHHIKTAHGR
jgi:hypothetical protein